MGIDLSESFLTENTFNIIAVGRGFLLILVKQVARG